MVQVIRKVHEFRSWRAQQLQHSVGFVPTMGALHAGHCTLIEKSLDNNDATVVSIFVNPSQFAPSEDLDSYPRTFDADLEKLQKLRSSDGSKSVNVVFSPTVPEMYPSGIPLTVSDQRGAFVSVLGVSEQLEGKSRPQFFRGVATVVIKLLHVVCPTRAYFGQKDAQQTVVIRKMVSDLLIDVEIVIVPTVREKSGLAMSSRNTYMDQKTKDQAAAIYSGLSAGKALFESGCKTSKNIKQEIHRVLEPYNEGQLGNFQVEYLCVNDPNTLDELEIIGPDGAIVSIAVNVPVNGGKGNVRLIDNVVLK